MTDQENSPEEFDPRVSERGRRALVRMRRVEAEARAAGRWKTLPPFEDTDKFDGPIGADAEGNVIAYHTAEEARAAGIEWDRRRRAETENLRRAEAREMAGEFERWLLESAVVHPTAQIRSAAAEYERRFLESPVAGPAFEKGREIAMAHYQRWLESDEPPSREGTRAMQDEFQRLWRETTDSTLRAEARAAAAECERRWQESVGHRPGGAPEQPGRSS